MKVLFAAAECAPFFKTGGLGDVAGALPKELKKQGIDVAVVLPFYTTMPQLYKDQLEDVMQFEVKVGWRNQFCGIKKLIKDNVTYYFIDNLYYFDRPSIYGFDDDGERYAFFAQAICEMMEKIEFIPDVLHVNDWHTAIIPVLLKDKYHWIKQYKEIKTMLTIHNLQFQGIYNQAVLSDWYGIGYNAFHEQGLKYYEDVNCLKGGIFFADHVTTVSPTYAQEIQTAYFGEGLDGVLRQNNYKLSGILNGIDYDVFNPATDDKIEAHFSIDDRSGKALDKALLQERVGLPIEPEVPLMSMVSRLTTQKGCHLLQEKMDELMQRDIQVLILGTGETEYEESFRYFTWRYPDKFKVIVDFDTTLAQQIYAGSDLFIMPSAFEPCGLSQLYSLRYGTLPIVHETGGLKDTVEPYNAVTGKGTGFSFYDYRGHVMLKTIDQALTVYYDEPDQWDSLIEQAMQQDFSWEKSTESYIEQYKAL
ncbi:MULTISPECIES: glycogen synthase GlgA [Carnobacterium]|uniref:Glycogen synthase n=1 Tax=Carnobacterium antarcticum TaxID=2126436 RepID=A0ABW4NJM0_9LACT|nr:glycogen synthase GlgA [Carnobacterium sp. CP1]ALV21738.1 Glycogen synthase, ADP-glucose transglucosylase [Carnobacterium sp. CP1]